MNRHVPEFSQVKTPVFSEKWLTIIPSSNDFTMSLYSSHYTRQPYILEKFVMKQEKPMQQKSPINNAVLWFPGNIMSTEITFKNTFPFINCCFFSINWTVISPAPLLPTQRGTQALSPRQGCSPWRAIPTLQLSNIQPTCSLICCCSSET
jgi:hypothetical protein